MTAEKQNITNADEPMSFMNPMTACVNKAIKNGYTDTLKMTRQGLLADKTGRTYGPDEVKIIDFFRFEGESDPADNSIMYVIEAPDGVKGVLVDAYGTYADANVNKFMTEVEEISKKEKKC